jgi:hypothetical protein
MNIAKVSKTAAFVNYVKPELAIVEMEVEGAILGTSGGGGNSVEVDWDGTGPGGPTPGGSTGYGDGGNSGAVGSSYRPRTKRR